MSNYLAAPMMVDRHTQGLRGPQLRIAHTEFDLVMEDVAKLLDSLFKGDRRIGNNKKFSDKVVLMDENEMTAVMMGFPTLKGLSRETPSVYVSVLLNQYAMKFFIMVYLIKKKILLIGLKYVKSCSKYMKNLILIIQICSRFILYMDLAEWERAIC